jgi:predicted NUDIX family NTP pyrophosphohydrolase
MTQRKTRSAGLLVYRVRAGGAIEVLLAHPGGPFFARKDAGAWSIPKGEISDDEDPRACALREFEEETGQKPVTERWLELGSVRQRGGKEVLAWAVEGDWPGGPPRSNTFEIEWPPRSGKRRSFPEIDRLEFFSLDEARSKLNAAQIEFLDRLQLQLRPSD